MTSSTTSPARKRPRTSPRKASLPSKSATVASSVPALVKEERQILPVDVVPSHYDIAIAIDLDQLKFKGSETVKLNVKKAVKEISLHSLDLAVSNVVLKLADGTTMTPCGEPAKDMYVEESLTFNFEKEIPEGFAELSMDFAAELNSNMVGLYRSKYTNTKGESCYMATTQFEATDARRAFPCWDEPLLKATFSLALDVHNDFTALSNMPVVSEGPVPGGESSHKRIVFDKTPIMSTYLLAFCVGEFEYVEGETKEGVLIRVYCTPGQKDKCDLSLQTAIHSLSFYGNYFDIHYPLPKLDMIGIPDFAAGAMENWGLVTYREISLLCEKDGPVRRKKAIVSTVAHELAHQWFGNLVTMEWWTDLWLNEGFATWMSYLACHDMFPEWQVWNDFSTDEYNIAMNLDSLESSHPVQCPVKKSSEVNEIFDTISYCKGSCVIRQLVDFLGAEDFRKGIQMYLKKHQYGNAITTDLWNSLGEASGKDVAGLMCSYTLQVGYPLIFAKEVGGDDKMKKIEVNQNRFLQSGHKQSDLLWKVPLSSLTRSSDGNLNRTMDLVEDREAVIEVPVESKDSFVKLNAGQCCLYRVLYSPEMWKALFPAIKDRSLDVADRLNVLNDGFALCQAGMLPVPDLLMAIESFSGDPEYLVWSEIVGILSYLLNVWCEDEKITALLNKFGLKLCCPLAKEYSLDNTEDTDKGKLFRALTYRAVTMFGSESYMEMFVSKFKELAAGNMDALDGDIRPVAYRCVAENRPEMFDDLMKMLDTVGPVDRVNVLNALGHAPDENKLKVVLDLITGDKIRSQDAIFPIRGMSVNKKIKAVGWQFLKDNFAALKERYGCGNMNYLGGFVKNLTSTFASEDCANEVFEFFQQNPLEPGMMDVTQAIERIRTKASWKQRDSEAMLNWLESANL
eukprot:Nk52_evm93s485 gene=Nk52_evmTU93s485